MLASMRRNAIPRSGNAASAHQGSFQVLDRTFSILELFDEERPEWSATEVARALDLPVPTAHRILAALRQRGYVSQYEETKRFRLGNAALRLGDRARAVVDLRSLALPALRRLSRDTGETALLTVLTARQDHGMCLERVETSQPLRLSVQPGRQLPLHAGASQKALMAFMDPTVVERLLARPLERLCTYTITAPELLREELQRIRDQGWASSLEETNVGVWGLAAPILDAHREVVCAVGIAGPIARLAEDRVDLLVSRIHDGAREIADTLGGSVPEVKRTRKAGSKRTNPRRKR